MNIVNPSTNKSVLISSNEGRLVLRNYLKYFLFKGAGNGLRDDVKKTLRKKGKKNGK